MKNVAIVGLGKISMPHIYGLKNNSDKYKIVAVCDIDRKLITTAEELGVPFFEDYKEVAKLDNVDIVIILTPPSTHYEIAKEMLFNKKHAFIEKPGVLDINHLHDLYRIAEENGVVIEIMYHWYHGNEVWNIKDRLHSFGKLYKIECTAYDPYTLVDNKTIKPESIGLSGAWNDSGINILSMLMHFVKIKDLKLVNEYIEYDTTNKLPIFVRKTFDYNGLPIIINCDWRENKNHKFSNFFFEEGTLFVHHTAQEVWFNANRVESYYNDHRLITHYTNLFKNTELNMSNKENTIALHEVLLITLIK